MKIEPMQDRLRKVALLGNYPPRKCGIATFTSDLADAILEQSDDTHVDVIAMADGKEYAFPPLVALIVDENDLEGYARAAAWVNDGGYDALLVQHEYGIFGGPAGAFLLRMLREVRVPIITTLHTVLREPTPEQKSVMDEVLALSSEVIVMSKTAVDILTEVHGRVPTRVSLIPHGIPTIPENAGARIRQSLTGRCPIILTFGLLSPDKGIEHVIRAMPRIVAECPEATYLVVGATHPNVVAHHGEIYRESLEALAAELGVGENVVFVNEFVPLDRLVEYLDAMDYYITPYHNPHQITSGTLAYALGAGKVTMSTPYRYAEDLLGDGRGVLVPFRNPDAIADTVLLMERDPDRRAEIGRKAWECGEEMRWSAVGRSYLKIIGRAAQKSAVVARAIVASPNRGLPKLSLDHLKAMTDDTGILQHAKYGVPDRYHGYCTDDNARALLFCGLSESHGLWLEEGRYLSFLAHAFDPAQRRFRNFMSFERTWLETVGSEDSHGRAVWALGHFAANGTRPERTALAGELFRASVGEATRFTSPRAWCFTILGMAEYLRAFPGDLWVVSLMKELGDRLESLFEEFADREWPWFEDVLSYDNARMPHACLVAGTILGSANLKRIGYETLDWLCEVQRDSTGVFLPIGSNGFYPRDGKRAYYDQQPLEAWATVSACLDAWRLSGDERWRVMADRAFRWYQGENTTGLALCDEETGSCADGLHPDRVNENRGAESTLAYLCALAEMQAAKAVETPSSHKHELAV